MKISVIGVPFALGGIEDGPYFGPGALFRSGILCTLDALGHESTYRSLGDAGNALVLSAEHRKRFPTGRIHYEHEVHEVCKLSGAAVFCAHRTGRFPLVLGGDHSISAGTLPQFLALPETQGRRVGLLWIDAHYDAHTDRTTHSHHANGLPLASVLGRGKRSLGVYQSNARKSARVAFSPPLVLHVGAGYSDCEPEEIALMQKLNVQTLTMADLSEQLDVPVLKLAVEALLSRVDDLIITFDLDAVHEEHAPAVSFRSKHGMHPEQLFMIADLIKQSGKLRQLEIMEYNPDFEVVKDGVPVTASFVHAFFRRLL